MHIYYCHMIDKKIILLGASVLVVGASAIYGMGELIVSRAEQESGNKAYMPPVHAMIATISSIDGDSIKVRGRVGGDDASLRTVIANRETSIKALVPLSGNELLDSMAQSRKDTAGTEAQVPLLYKEVSLDPSDLRLTMEVNVVSKDDIRTATTITADQITFFAPPSAPPEK
jgi:hypothetical protein